MALPPSSEAAERTVPPAHRGGHRVAVWISVVAAVLLVVSAGGVAAAARFDARHHSEFLPGVTVNEVAIGGMDFAEARRVVAGSVDQPLDHTLTVTAADKTFTLTPREMGATTDLERQLKEAANLHRTMPASRRVWHRLTGSPVEASFEVTTQMADTAVGPFVDRVAAAVDVPARDGAPQLGPGDVLHFTPGVAGRSLDRAGARRRIFEALRKGEDRLALDTVPVAPAVSASGTPDVLVIKVGDNKLLHFHEDQLVRTYDVATGQKRYPTPKGLFKLVNKRFRPTWVNPAKYRGGWGAGLPAKIGPGPNNPLGTRAMDLSAGGIRIHGSSNDAAIGYNVSHGCIRMHMAEVEELFDLVNVGTPVLILETAPLRAQPAAPHAPTLEDLAEADGTQIPGVAPVPGRAPAAVPPAPAPAPVPAG